MDPAFMWAEHQSFLVWDAVVRLALAALLPLAAAGMYRTLPSGFMPDMDEGAFILKRGKNNYTIKAHTTIEEFNEYFHTSFSDDDYDTVGGLVMQAFGRLPKREETIRFGDFDFRVLHVNNRRIGLVELRVLPGISLERESS